MADPLVELDEAIEKAGLMPRGGSRAAWRAMVKRDGANAKGIASGKTPLARGLSTSARLKRARSFTASRVGKFNKSADPIEALDAAFEKARGLLPKGGSSRMLRVARKRAEQGKLKTKAGWSYKRQNEQQGAVQSYLRTRKPNGRVASRFKGYVEARQSKNYK